MSGHWPRHGHKPRPLLGAVAAPSRAQIAEHKRETAVLLSLAARNAPRAAADPASALPFQRGDVFAVTSSGVQEYTPTGQLVQTIPASGADVLCFDPSGQHLIVPGAGLFDSSGHLLPSNWAAVNLGGPGEDGGRPECVADGRGDVYGISGAGVLTKYDLQGNVLQTFPLAQVDFIQVSIDLAPDECTMYYSAWAAPPTFTGPFNVCTNTLENSDPYPWGFQTSPTIFAYCPIGGLSGAQRLWWECLRYVRTVGYGVPDSGGSFRHLALDPDGTSLWRVLCCLFRHQPRPRPTFSTSTGLISTPARLLLPRGHSIRVQSRRQLRRCSGTPTSRVPSTRTPPVRPRRSSRGCATPGSCPGCTCGSTRPLPQARPSWGSTPTITVIQVPCRRGEQLPTSDPAAGTTSMSRRCR